MDRLQLYSYFRWFENIRQSGILITSRDGVPDKLPVLAHGLPVAGQRLLVLEADLLEHAARSLHQGLRLPPREHRHKWTLRFHREI